MSEKHFEKFFNRDSVKENIVGGVQKIFVDKLVQKGMGISLIARKFPKKVFLTHPKDHGSNVCCQEMGF